MPYKEPEYEKTLVTFSEISKEEYQNAKDKYYVEPVFLKTDTLPNMVEREGNCFKFKQKDNTFSKLELCDDIPTAEEGEVGIQLYKNPVYIDTINAYFIRKNFYEGGKIYLLNANTADNLVEIMGTPIFSPDKKYFFIQVSKESPYSYQFGLEIWKVRETTEFFKDFYKLAYFSPEYFGSDVVDAFWVNDEIYISIFWRNYPAYLKATINEFPTNLPRG